MLHIDRKYDTDGTKIINHFSGEELPADEPLILFRGHDKLLVPLLEAYKKMCAEAGSLPKHIALLEQRIQDIQSWQTGHQAQVKMPGTGAHYAKTA